MKKALKVTLFVVLSIVVLIGIITFIKSTFLQFSLLNFDENIDIVGDDRLSRSNEYRLQSTVNDFVYLETDETALRGKLSIRSFGVDANLNEDLFASISRRISYDPNFGTPKSDSFNPSDLNQNIVVFDLDYFVKEIVLPVGRNTDLSTHIFWLGDNLLFIVYDKVDSKVFSYYSEYPYNVVDKVEISSDIEPRRLAGNVRSYRPSLDNNKVAFIICTDWYFDSCTAYNVFVADKESVDLALNLKTKGKRWQWWWEGDNLIITQYESPLSDDLKEGVPSGKTIAVDVNSILK